MNGTTSPAALFFANRRISIPDMDPEKWVEGLDRDRPVSASFTKNYRRKTWSYQSGTGRTVATYKPGKHLLIYTTEDGAEHAKELAAECRRAIEEAGRRVVDSAGAMEWPVRDTVYDTPPPIGDTVEKGLRLVACLAA